MSLKKIAFVVLFFAGDGFCAELSRETADVVVVGGGAAGICAAAQSGQLGVKTILLEAGNQVGGNMTTGGVNFPGLFHAWGKQVIAGIGWSLVTNCVALDGGALPDFFVPTGRQHWKHQIHVNIPLFVALAEETLSRSGVNIHYHAAPQEIAVTAEGWKLRISAAGDTRTIFCRQLVDCTGNATVVALAGFTRLRGEVTQPGTLNYMLARSGLTLSLDAKALRDRYTRALEAGELDAYDIRGGAEGILSFVKTGAMFGNYVTNADNSTCDARTRTNLRGRASMLRVFRFLQSLPDMKGLHLREMAQEVGVRETYRAQGEILITEDDYTSGKVWEDSVCYAFYPIDQHVNKTGVHPAHLREGTVATVPLRALIPQGANNLLAAGRCLSSDRLANAALRVEATCMATGQAAGAAAALAARLHTTPAKVPFRELAASLRKHGALVPEK